MNDIFNSSTSILLRLVTCLLLLGMASTGMAQQKYPSRPITCVVPWGPGGGADQMARMAAHSLEPVLGVSIPVINVPGATGQSGMAKLLTQPADGYSFALMTGDTAALWVSRKLPFQFKDITPLAVLEETPSGFFVKEDSPIKNWASLEKVSKGRTLKVAVTGFGSPDDITVKFFRSKGLKLESVPYTKPSARYTSILGGHADVLYEQPGDIRTYIYNKQIRPIIFFYNKKFVAFPNVPVSGDLGYDIAMPQFRVLLAKVGTDPEHIKILEEAIMKFATSKEYKNWLKKHYDDPDSYVAGNQAFKFMSDWLKTAERVMMQGGMKKH